MPSNRPALWNLPYGLFAGGTAFGVCAALALGANDAHEPASGAGAQAPAIATTPSADLGPPASAKPEPAYVFVVVDEETPASDLAGAINSKTHGTLAGVFVIEEGSENLIEQRIAGTAAELTHLGMDVRIVDLRYARD